MCRRHGIFPTQLAKWKEQFIESGKKGLSDGIHQQSREEEIDNLKRMIGEQTLVKNAFKNATRRVKMIVVEDLREYMSLREISSVSGISLSSFYYREKERSVIRLSPQIEYDIIRVASERPTYGYWKVWAMIRNNGIRVNRKAVRRVLRERNLSLPYSKHRGRTESRNIFHSTGPDQLW
ncbi:MAG: IS3 family transposase [Candidatus Micrarchaeaceae archaeon]